MYNVEIFTKEEFGSIRTIEIDGQVYFVASDVAKSLGYTNTSKAISDHCRWVTKRYIPHPQNKAKTLAVNVIPRGDVVRLAAQSKLPGAEKFESWIFDEVIPSVLHNGGYIVGQETLTDDELLEKALIVAQRRIAERDKLIKEKNKQITEMKPKVEFFDAVADSKDAIEMGQVAKVLDYPGIGRNNLFEILRDHKILRKNNEPYQKYIDNGMFRTIEQKYNMPDGSQRINIKTLVYQKGVDYIRKILDDIYLE